MLPLEEGDIRRTEADGGSVDTDGANVVTGVGPIRTGVGPAIYVGDDPVIVTMGRNVDLLVILLGVVGFV